MPEDKGLGSRSLEPTLGNVSSGAAAKQGMQDVLRSVDIDSMMPKGVDREDAMSQEQVDVHWERMFGAAGMRGADEKKKLQFKLAVLVYAYTNGTSSLGNYNAWIQLADGSKYSSRCIIDTCGTSGIRRFFRGNADFAASVFAGNSRLAAYSVLAARAFKNGVPFESMYAMGDFMADCPSFTPSEISIHDRMFKQKINRAAAARSGKTIEEGIEKREFDNGTVGTVFKGQTLD